MALPTSMVTDMPRTTLSDLLTPDDVLPITGLSPDTLAQWRSQTREIPYLSGPGTEASSATSVLLKEIEGTNCLSYLE
jgi:hypothetical protein